jgi:uncharacterized protein Veg
MKKISLTLIGLYILLLNAFSQTIKDSSLYKARPLRLDEVNIVSSYYTQDGNHSAITGGIGTEKVTDFSNGIELKFVGVDNRLRKHTLTTGAGLDHHTAASAAYVSKTGASQTGGTRLYPSIDWTVENETKRTSFGVGSYYSHEYNYKSFGADIHFSAKTKDKSGEFGAKFQGYFDQVTMIYPSELIPATTKVVNPGGTITITTASGRKKVVSASGAVISGDDDHSDLPTSPRNTYTASFSYSQIVNARLQVMFLLDLVSQNGYLGLPFHRVYMSNGLDTIEKLPPTRFKLPVGVRANYFMGDNIVFRSYFRYYTDDWGIKSTTASLEVPIKVTPFFSVSPYYRYYKQTAATYFGPYKTHTLAEPYYSSNYSLSAFSSSFYGMGVRMAPPGGILNNEKVKDMEIRYGHYTQTTSLNSNVISISMTFK